jgi:sugar lactone lactonase YvrE
VAPESTASPAPGGRAVHRPRRPTALIVASLLLAAGLGSYLAWRYWPAGPRPSPAPPWPVTVTTLAGGGSPGASDGFASAAAFSDPFGIAVDAGGNVFVADAGDNNLIRRIAPSGEVTTLAGGEEGWLDGPGTAARFNTPSAIAVAPDGSLVVADTGNHAIRRVGVDGTVTTVAGGGLPGLADGPAATARFDGPIGVTVAADATIFVADTYNDCIRRIAPDGTVSTLAGGGATGYRDGAGMEARFDTPSAIAIGAGGVLFVADTGNNLLRRIDPRGEVTTVGVGTTGLPPALVGPGVPAGGSIPPLTSPGTVAVALWRPAGVAVSPRGDVYATDALGRIASFSPGGGSRLVAGSTAGFADGDGAHARLNGPAALAIDAAGRVFVADSENYLVRVLTPPGAPLPARDVFLMALPRLSPAVLGFEHVPWPVDPQEGWHEVTATLGEARGSVGGDGRERLHAGIDVHAEEGALVRAVHDEKVSRPIAPSGYGELNEMLHAGLVSYVHVRVGRDRRDATLDASRFPILFDENGAPTRVRIRRGTRLRLGDPVGTVNRFAHVHLGLGPRGAETNLLRFSLPEFSDHVAPTIPVRGVWLEDEAGRRVAPRAGRFEFQGRARIVAEAWDQVDRNERRRRLGVYSLGYQVLRRDGTPAPGFDEPRTTIVFDRLPQTPGAGELAYAEGSGITVYGNRATRFRYVVTNQVRDGEASEGWWDTSALAPGDYRVRVVARDFAGNEATREIGVRVGQPQLR